MHAVTLQRALAHHELAAAAASAAAPFGAAGARSYEYALKARLGLPSGARASPGSADAPAPPAPAPQGSLDVQFDPALHERATVAQLKSAVESRVGREVYAVGVGGRMLTSMGAKLTEAGVPLHASVQIYFSAPPPLPPLPLPPARPLLLPHLPQPAARLEAPPGAGADKQQQRPPRARQLESPATHSNPALLSLSASAAEAAAAGAGRAEGVFNVQPALSLENVRAAVREDLRAAVREELQQQQRSPPPPMPPPQQQQQSPAPPQQQLSPAPLLGTPHPPSPHPPPTPPS
jgi:hypothetical protein